jgi:hypothetical protein
MRGDIDGDGKITENDRNRINEHLGGTITLTGADSWCAKVTGNNEISASDLVQLMRYLEGKTNNLTGIPTFADYYNNWTYHKVDDLTGYWTAGIAINGLKTTSDAIVNISNDEGIFYKSELSDGAIRFYATRPPIAEVFATITFKSGTGVITTSYESAKFHASTHSKNGADPIAPTAIGAVGYDAAQNLTDTQKTQARTNINAAPDGFGLGNIGKLLTPEDNLDEVKTNGWYRWERKAIAEKATAHKLYHTTLCNHLLTLTRRATTTAELDKITYSADCLPLDLAQNMQKVLAASGVTE